MISKRAQAIDTSGIRRMFDLIATMKNPVNLSIGQPSYDALDELKQGAVQAINAGKSRYTVTQGIEELRREVRQRYHIDGASDCETLITAGVSGGFVLSYMAMLDPGDEVLMPDPFFGMYRDVAYLLNARPVYYDMYPEFRLPLEQIEAQISERTRAIVINNPGNPSGAALSEEDLLAVLEIARRHKIWIIYDEIYSAFCYDRPHVNIFGRYEQTVILNGFGKSHGVPGWRIAYAVGPAQIIREMIKMQQYTFICAPSLVQYAVLGTLALDLSDKLEEYRKKRDFIYNALRDRYSMVKPGGAFYMFPEAPGGMGGAFVERCLKENLLVVPGSAFSRRDTHFRLSFSASWEDLEKGAEILRRLAE